MVHVPYKGAGPAITDLIGGRLDFMITTLPSVVGFIKSGKVKALAVTTQDAQQAAARRADDRRERLGRLPGRAPGTASSVPKGTPAEVSAKLREATVESLKARAGPAPASRSRVPSPSATRPRSSAASCRANSKRWAELIKSAGLTPTERPGRGGLSRSLCGAASAGTSSTAPLPANRNRITEATRCSSAACSTVKTAPLRQLPGARGAGPRRQRRRDQGDD